MTPAEQLYHRLRDDAGCFVALADLTSDCPPALLESAATSLEADGVTLERHPAFGWRLPDVPDAPIAAEISYQLTTQRLGRPSLFLHQTTSTNDVAMRLAAEGAGHGTLVIADVQTAARGRRGRSWDAPAGVGLWCSLLLESPPPRQAGLLTLMLGSALARAIQINTAVDVGLSWPNDLVVSFEGGQRKVGGILCEQRLRANASAMVVAGFGVDVNQARFADNLVSIAASLRQVTGRLIPRAALLKSMLQQIEQDWERLNGGDDAFILAQARHLSVTVGHRVRLQLTHGTVEGTAVDLADDGALLVRDDAGAMHQLHSGEVQRTESE